MAVGKQHVATGRITIEQGVFLMNMESRTEAITREIFSQVRTSIVMKMRFLDMAVFKLKAFPTQLTFATDGTFLYYRPIWLLKQYQEEPNNVTRDYMHILLHCIFRHPFVNTLVDQQLWNLSCDIAAEHGSSILCQLMRIY